MKSLFLAGFFVLASAIAQAERAPGPAVAAALRADEVRLGAMVAGDANALGAVLSDDLIFVHSDGRSETKAEYVKNLLAGDTGYAETRTYQVDSLQNDTNSVVLTGFLEMKKRLGPKWEPVKLRYLSVWRNESGTWRMVAWLSARPAGNSVPPKQ